MDIYEVDREWAVWCKCPQEACKVVFHACCEPHLRDAVIAHCIETADHEEALEASERR